MNIAVAGTGYVGLSLAVLLAQHNEVTAVDIVAEKVEKLAKWAVDHPTAVFDLTGYADKDTGTAKLNMALSEKRAAAVKDALVKKGIQANRISVNWKGDTIQPFNMNDDNRVVVVLGEEK